MDITDPDDEGFAPVDFTYIGQGGKAGTYVWRDHNDVPRTYSKLRARVPGGIYTISAKPGEGAQLTVLPATLTYTGRRSPDAASLQLREDELERDRAAVRLAKNTTKTQDIDDALEGVLALAAKLTFGDRRLLADLVHDKILSVRR